MFETAGSIGDILSSFVVFLIGFFVVEIVRKYFRISLQRAYGLYLWHTVFCIVYLIYSLSTGADSTQYFATAVEGDIYFTFGSSVIEIITYALVSLGLSYLGCFLVFNIFGLIGLLAFDSSIQSLVRFSSRASRFWATVIILLPSVSFWSSGIGKDSLAFMSVGLALWAAINLQKRVLIMLFAILVMLLVRPHMAVIMILSLAFSMMLSSVTGLLFRLSLILLSVLAAIILIPFTVNYVGLSGVSDVSGVMDYIYNRQNYNLDGGAALDIASMSLSVQLFTYLFRPLPFDAHSVFSLIASMENVILLVFSIFCLRGLFTTKIIDPNHIFMWTYFLAGALILSMVTSNLGISVRQKWMLMPILIYLLFSMFVAREQRKYCSRRIRQLEHFPAP